MNKLTIAVALCSACTINGKTFGKGPTSPPPSAPSGSSGSSEPAAADTAPAINASSGGVPTVPAAGAPQDPWLAVQGDQPKRLTTDRWEGSEAAQTCNAAHDHCLPPGVWFLMLDSELAAVNPFTHADVASFGPDGAPLYAENVRERMIDANYVAFRTVPATRANLVPGAIVFGLQRPTTLPKHSVDAMLSAWHYGVVESVDLDVGVYKLVADKDTLMLPGARVAVLRWAPGGKVEIVGGKPKTQLAVSAKDVFLPEP